MTDQPAALQLPEQPALDAQSAGALAVMGELDRQLAGTDAAISIVLDPAAISRAVLDAIGGDFPRIPAWTGDPRELGGGSRPDQLVTDPTLRITDVAADGRVRVEIETDDGPLPDVSVPVADAETWFLAGLAACRAAREINPE